MAAEVEKFIYGLADDTQLRQQLVDIANNFGCTGGAQNEWASYFSNRANIQGIKEAYAKYGLPPKNRISTRSKGLFGRWTNYCDWGDTYRFFYYAKIAQDYPALNPQNKQNCYIIKGFISGLQSEKKNITQQYAIKNDIEKYNRELEVVGDKLNDFNSLNSRMSCQEYFSEQDRIIFNEQRKEVKDQSQKDLEDSFDKTASVSGGGTKVAIYVFGGVAALIGIMLLSRKKAA
jgi:hypothetical protein